MRRVSSVLALALVAMFVIGRAALLVTSYDANKNWEEPVFLFSGLELARDGIGHVFDHQDDLNHGGSVALLLVVVPWLRAFGTSLLALKGVAILWSAATLVAFLAVGWRHFSPRASLLFAACWVGVGILAGMKPEFWQNLLLRPPGARLWEANVSSPAAEGAIARVLAELAASFGWPTPIGVVLLISAGPAMSLVPFAGNQGWVAEWNPRV